MDTNSSQVRFFNENYFGSKSQKIMLTKFSPKNELAILNKRVEKYVFRYL